MKTARQGKEILVKIHNDVGIMRDLAKIVAEKGVNLLAASSWVEGKDGYIRLITDDNLRAKDALEEHKYAPEERDVILVTIGHSPGTLRSVLEELAENDLDVDHLYVTANINDANCLVVLSTANNDHAIVLING
jgi:hypothetical protein